MNKTINSQQKDIYAIWAKVNILYTVWADRHKINCNTLMLFYELDIYGQTSQKLLADHLGIPKQTVSNIVKSLLRENYVTMLPSERDKREKMLALTPQGKKYSRKFLLPLYELEQRTIRMVGEERIEQMLETEKLFNLVFEKNMEETE